MLTGATLFSGIGAPETAMPSWRWLWCAEIDKFPATVLAARHPASINLGDVSAHDFAERAAAIGRPDVLVFGSPCQSFSVAGRRRGMDDARGNLAFVALGIVEKLRPRWFVFENVPGLLSISGGRDFGLLLRTVDDIGYRGAWGVLDAQYTGVAQRRERVFFVGHARDWRGPAAVLFEPARLRGDSPPRREAGTKVARCLEASADRRSSSGINPNALTEVAATLSANGKAAGSATQQDAEAGLLVTHTLRAEGFDASEDGTGGGTPLAIVPFDTTQITSGVNRCRPEPGAPCHPLAAGAHPPAVAFNWQGGGTQTSLGYDPDAGTTGMLGTKQTPAVAFSCKDYGADAGALAPTLRAMGHTGSHANAGGQLGVATGAAVRRLTPRECERLQGFPDDYTLIQYRGRPPTGLATRPTATAWRCR